ncbi:MAG: radical SAM protein [Desulfomonile tiedjei]|nr:radical SAM protein [Desulfomonile tiedjei]
MIPSGKRIGHACRRKEHVPRGLLLQWHITERCNLRCAHCYQDSYAGSELGFRDLLGILDQFADLLNRWQDETSRPVRGHITVTGGEPFTREDFPDLLEVLAAHRTRFSFAILTNGHSVDDSVARHLKGLAPAFVQVSIEGSQESHDKIRGAGSFARTIRAIGHLVRRHIRTFISFTAHRGNFREFAEVARLGRHLRVARVWADRLIPMGSGSSLREQSLTPEETLEFLQIVHKARNDSSRRWFGRTEIAMHRALQFLLAGGTPYHCTAGDTLITVMPNGDVYPCRRMPVRVGNLGEISLEELYRKSEFLRALRDRSTCSEGCEGCSYVGLCRGGLRCLSYAMSNDPFKSDPGCWLAGH